MTKAHILKALKYVQKYQPISRKDILRRYSDEDMRHLTSLQFIQQTQDSIKFESYRYAEKETDIFLLTDAGLDYLDDNATDLRRTWWPHIGNALLAIVAIIISLIALNK